METVKNIIQVLKEDLSGLYEERESEQIIRILFKEYAGWDAAFIVMHHNDVLDDGISLHLKHAGRRLKQGEPVQYIIGVTDFCGLRFFVRKGVLIPRPETEELVNEALQYIRMNSFTSPRILDIGTGSGCIAIALKKSVPLATVEAIDLSTEALLIAEENAGFNQVEVKFCQSDILNAEHKGLSALYDIIVTNPPYIPESEKKHLHRNILGFEPASALFVADENPLLFYDAIADVASGYLKRPGYLIAEIHEAFGKEVLRIFQRKDFSSARIIKDLNGKDRFISVILQEGSRSSCHPSGREPGQ